MYEIDLCQTIEANSSFLFRYRNFKNVLLHLPLPQDIKKFCCAPLLNKFLAKFVMVGIARVRGLVMKLTNTSIFAISFFQKDKGDDIFGDNILILRIYVVPDI